MYRLDCTTGATGQHEHGQEGGYITEYINFCRDTVMPVKTVHCFPNNKPSVYNNSKQLLNQKNLAFKKGDKERLQEVQLELKGRLRQAKLDYKRKVESKLQQNNVREVWKGMRDITSYSKKNSQVMDGDVDKANHFNLFLNRFDGGGSVHPTLASILSSTVSPASSPSSTTAATATTHSQLTQSFRADKMRAELRKLCTVKSCGPGWSVSKAPERLCSPASGTPSVAL